MSTRAESFESLTPSGTPRPSEPVALRASDLEGPTMELLTRLTAGIAHEYNNLLMGIQGCAKLARRRIGDDHPGAPFVLEAERAAKRGAALTRQLLAFGTQRDGREGALDLDAVIARATSMLHAVAGSQIELTATLGAPGWRIPGDEAQLEEMLVHLVLNARDAMPDGGSIAITTRETTVDATEGSPAAGDYVVLTVSDTGRGMDGETLEHAFEPFYTTKHADARPGLGLSAVYGIVRARGGDILVESALGRGTTISLFLPRVESTSGLDEEPETEELPTEPPDAVGLARILLVEGDRLRRTVIRGTLESHGHAVVEARDLAEAKGAVDRSVAPFDLVITAVTLPDGSGERVAARTTAVAPSTPVIFVDAHSAPIPFDEESLMREVARVIGRGRRPSDDASAAGSR